MSKHTNKQKKRSPRLANTVRFPLPFVMLLCWMRSYAGDEECSCGASPDYEIDSFVDAEGLLGAEGPAEKDRIFVKLRGIDPNTHLTFIEELPWNNAR